MDIIKNGKVIAHIEIDESNNDAFTILIALINTGHVLKKRDSQ